MREHLNEVAPRRTAVLDPLKLIIDNYPEGAEEECLAPNHPQKPELGKRACRSRASCGSSARISWKSRPRAYFRLYPGKQGALALRLRDRMHRLRQGRCGQGHRGALQLLRRQQIGYYGFGQLQGQRQYPLGLGPACLSLRGDALRPAVPRPQPGAGERDFLLDLNPEAKKIISAQLGTGAEECASRRSASSSSATAISSPIASTPNQVRRCSTARSP